MNQNGGQTPSKTHNQFESMATKRTINSYTKRGRASQNVRNRTKHQGKLNRKRTQSTRSVAVGCQSTPTRAHWTPKQCFTNRTNPNKHATLCASTVKALASELAPSGPILFQPMFSSCSVWLSCKPKYQNTQKNTFLRQVTGGETSSKTRNQCGVGRQKSAHERKNRNHERAMQRKHNEKRATKAPQTGSKSKKTGGVSS